jgi:hypothetical protein
MSKVELNARLESGVFFGENNAKNITDSHTDLDRGSSLESSEINLLVGRHGERALNSDRAAAFSASNLVVGCGDASGTFLNREWEKRKDNNFRL